MEAKHLHDPTWDKNQFTTFFQERGYKEIHGVMVKPETNQIVTFNNGELFRFKADTQEEFDACMDELIPPEETKK